MRKLLYVPIIHSDEDMGDIGTALSRRSAELVGEARWVAHKETVGKFWDSIAEYLRSVGPGRMKVYQDGLPVDGEIGRRIVQEAARRGSRNHQLILELIDGGAELRKTEDLALLLQERENILGLSGQQTTPEEQRDALHYRAQRDHLMEARDRFMAETIHETLKPGETGVLFIGSQHNVASHLAEDISVEMVKSPTKASAYFEELFSNQNSDEFEELRQHMIAPVEGLLS